MTGHRRYHLPAAVATLTAAVLAAGTLPAAAHQHPTPIERAAPGVVYVEARPQVEVALIEHKQKGDSFGVHIGIAQSTWRPVLATASGFVVDPTGAIVTTGAITAPDLDRARVFAVNQAFHQRYGSAAPLPSDPYAPHRIGASTDRTEQRLEACYPPNRTNDAGGCVVKVTPDFVVYPYVTSQQRYGQLHAEVLAGSTRDVAVLRVRGANSMPTVGLGQSSAGALALGALGFTAVPGPAAPNRLIDVPTHLAEVGGNTLKTKNLPPDEVKYAAALVQGLRHGMAGGPLVAERGQVIGFLTPLPSGSTQRVGVAPPLVGIGAILTVLGKAGVSPHGGPVDTSFEAAMHQFKNGGFAESVPGFTTALQLFPGHLLASENLATAKREAAGTTATVTPTLPSTGPGGSQPSGDNAWLLALLWIAPVLLLLAAAAAWFLLRRRRRTGGTDTAPQENAPRAQPSAPPSGKAAHVSRSAVAASSAAGALSVGSGGRTSKGAPGAATRSGEPAAASSRALGGASGQGSRQQAQAAPRRGDASPAPAARPAGRVVPAPVQGSDTPPSRVDANGAASSRSAPSSRTQFCTTCGERLADRHRYCGSCGEPVG